MECGEPPASEGFELEFWPRLVSDGFWLQDFFQMPSAISWCELDQLDPQSLDLTKCIRGPGCGQLLQAVCHGVLGCRTLEAALETLLRLFHGKHWSAVLNPGLPFFCDFNGVPLGISMHSFRCSWVDLNSKTTPVSLCSLRGRAPVVFLLSLL